MTIFRKAKKKEVLVGAHMPQWVHSYFAIYCLAKGMTRTALFRKLYEEFIDKQRITESEDDLINQIVLRCKRAYKNKPLRYDLNIDEYREEVVADLRIKGIPEGYIKIIIRRLTFD